ncbi:MAG TPA: radical SAM protein [Phycisphaerae bacterium]|nr:radical SAM protein [Phycisphaerae bacterium]HNU44751.1 radical SAM protein [Phycisphaerae bacterium]
MRQQLFDVDVEGLIRQIHPKYRAVWEGLAPEDQRALALYFLPHRSAKDVLEPKRPRVIKWYCPFAAQCDFPSGHRYCINVFTGCAHHCEYCYAQAYEPDEAAPKSNFERLLLKDLDDLERWDVPPAPVHLSNSTDPFQPLEATAGHTRLALTEILRHRYRFTTVTILTKNPLLPVRRGYLDLFQALGTLPEDHPRHAEFAARAQPGFVIEVSLAFWREDARQHYDPGAPPLDERIEGLRALHAHGIPLVLRIDPLFPRSPLPTRPPASLADFDLPEAQTLDDLERLAALAKDLHARHVVYSPVKIVQPRGGQLSPTMQALRRVYEACARPAKPVFRGGSWRLPDAIARAHIIQPFLDICRRYDMPAKYCKHNLIETP